MSPMPRTASASTAPVIQITLSRAHRRAARPIVPLAATRTTPAGAGGSDSSNTASGRSITCRPDAGRHAGATARTSGVAAAQASATASTQVPDGRRLPAQQHRGRQRRADDDGDS